MKRRSVTAILSASAIALIIFDSESTAESASQAILLCTKTVIPSLFPLMVLSILLCSSLSGGELNCLRPLGRLLKIPQGYESLLIPAALGGYPVGAQTIHQAYQEGGISKRSAQRLLTFCNNAGPSFIFGIVGAQFDSRIYPWLLWLIQLLSAATVAFLIPSGEECGMSPKVTDPISFTAAIKKAIKSMAEICGCILLFRVFIRFVEKSFLLCLPIWLQTIIIGILELSNGCVQLNQIIDPGMRFLAASTLLSFGGICVQMQTRAVTGSLGIKSYLQGKLLQTLISLILSFALGAFIFTDGAFRHIPAVIPLMCVLLLILSVAAIGKRRKNSSIPAVIGV